MKHYAYIIKQKQKIHDKKNWKKESQNAFGKLREVDFSWKILNILNILNILSYSQQYSQLILNDSQQS
eukprot:NODE_2633_length_1073_cov_6.388672_g2194_i0.p5 GENE.NODE_2633_length_1073_cov_6.388672_g2194_i0~~NODE_2633_length_1073_cov_6.388672_g2194_i0.p5  ORF type:complete len:68 (-),score=9.25 NODE_2633_length_1073_cov_6.388672_g2194_i0:494-697(-)